MMNIIKKLIMGIILIIGISAAMESSASAANAIYIDKESYRPGEAITVTYVVDNVSSLKRSPWIGIVPAHISHGSEYTNDCYDVAVRFVSGKSQTYTFSAPSQPGLYDFRLNDDEYGGSEIATSAVFEVGSKTSVGVSAISVDKTELGLNVGQRARITSLVEPENATNKSITWTSSDPSIVSVNSSGEVMALKEGVADITCRTLYIGKAATCKVCVSRMGSILRLNGENSFAAVGNEVQLNVSSQDIESVKSADMTIEYDSSKLKFLGADNSNGVKILKAKKTNNKVRMVCTREAADNSDNVLLSLKFKALSTGNASISMSSATIFEGSNRLIKLQDSQRSNKIVFIR